MLSCSVIHISPDVLQTHRTLVELDRNTAAGENGEAFKLVDLRRGRKIQLTGSAGEGEGSDIVGGYRRALSGMEGYGVADLTLLHGRGSAEQVPGASYEPTGLFLSPCRLETAADDGPGTLEHLGVERERARKQVEHSLRKIFNSEMKCKEV